MLPTRRSWDGDDVIGGQLGTANACAAVMGCREGGVPWRALLLRVPTVHLFASLSARVLMRRLLATPTPPFCLLRNGFHFPHGLSDGILFETAAFSGTISTLKAIPVPWPALHPRFSTPNEICLASAQIPQQMVASSPRPVSTP